MSTYNNAMRQAFNDIKVKPDLRGQHVANAILNCLRTKSGVVAIGRGYTTNLKYRTRQALIAQGIPV